MLSLAVQRLGECRWLMAREFSFFVMNDKSQLESTRLSGQINYWQSFKWSGKYEEVRAEVEDSDLSAKKPLFQLAHAAIRDDFGEFFKMLPGVLESGELMKNDLMRWPLFQGIRQRPEFAPFASTEKQETPDAEPNLGAKI